MKRVVHVNQSILSQLYKRYINPFRNKLLICLALMLLNSVASLTYPMFLKLIIDDAIGRQDVNKLIFFTVLMLLNIILIMMFGYWQRIKLMVLGQNINFEIKKEMVNRLQGYSLEFHKKYRSGEILSIIENDAVAVKQIATTMIGELVVSSITAIGLGIILFQMDYQIALLSLVLVSVFTYIQKRVGATIKTQSTNFSVVKGELFATTQELIASIYDAIMLNCESFITGRYYDKHKQYYGCERKVITTKSYADICGISFQGLALLLVICLGGYKVLVHHMTIGTLFTLSIYIQKIYSPINSLANLYVEYKKIEASLIRVFDLINNDIGVIQNGTVSSIEDLKGDVTFNNVSFGYDEGQILNDINMKINAGDKVALLGENGSGKTSILRLLLRMWNYSGDIFIGKYNLKDYRLECLRSNMTCIGQKPYIFHGSVKENIVLGNTKVTEEEIEMILDKVCLRDDIDNLPQGIDTIIGEKGVILSGGQAQKIAIARIYILRPSIIILDEPTSSLDMKAEEEICKNIFNDFSDKTIITVTHRKEILKHCTKVFEINGNRINENTERIAI